MTIRVLIAALALLFVSVSASAQSDSSFTYQGVLQDGGGPADGAYDLTFRLHDAAVGVGAFGNLFVSDGHPVVDGLFEIELDFGADALGLVGGRWLQITVNGVSLSPRIRITASPYSVQTRGIFVNNQNRVGIGTENPLGLLHLRKQTTSSNSPERMLVIDSHDDPNNFDLDIGSGSGILFKVPYQSDSRVGAAIDAVRTTVTEVNSSTALVFLTSANSQTLVEAMRIHPPGDLPTILASNNGAGPVLWASGSNDVSLGGGGMILIGAEAGLNLTMDRNEIMARNNGAPSSLFLNNDGGEVNMGEHRMHPAYAYGRLQSDGTLRSGSSNILSTSKLGTGTYEVVIEGGVLGSDIIIVSSSSSFANVGGNWNSTTGHLIFVVSDVDGDLIDREAQFVVYRP